MSLGTKSAGIPVVVVEDHNEVLYHIYRGIGSKKLPFENGTIIHFDSHPDMVIPENFDVERIFDKEYVLNSVSIESWLLPAVYAKHFSTIAWVKPPWASQLSEGKHEFQIGRHQLSKEMKLTCPEAYFVSELAWSASEELENISNVTLEVCTLVDVLARSASTDNSQEHECDTEHQSAFFKAKSLENLLSPKFLSCLHHKPFVLDIDLDFYSTRNPFLELFTAEQFKVLSELYHYVHPSNPLNQDSLCKVTAARQKQLVNLQTSIKQVKDGGDCSQVEDTRLSSLLASLKQNNSSVDLDLLHSAGCTCDDCDLPHHVSTRAEIHELVEHTKQFLQRLPTPSFITISRSSRDDYCPPEDVEFIQNLVLEMLLNVYGPLDIQHDYNLEENVNETEKGSCSESIQPK